MLSALDDDMHFPHTVIIISCVSAQSEHHTKYCIKDDSRTCELLMNAKQIQFKYELTSEWKSRLTSFMFTAHKPNMSHLFNMPFISGVSMSKARK